MGKDSKRIRKELRRFTKDKVADLKPRDVIRVFIEETMSRTLWQRLRFGFGLAVKSWRILPIHLTINEQRKEKGLPPVTMAGVGEK